MADPVTALAVVGNVASILQIIDFSMKVFHNAASLLDDKSPREAISFARLGKGYADAQKRVLAAAERPRPHTVKEAEMDRVALECSGEVQQLLDMLDDLRLDDSVRGAKRVAKATKLGFKAVRSRKAIEEKQQSIERLNGLLGTAMLENLRDVQVAFQDDLTAQMQRDTQGILSLIQATLNEINNEATRTSKKRERIAGSLRFKDTMTRQSAITKAYQETFAWIFDPKRLPLRDWLVAGEGVFWVSGVAGSGKSTFMKHLCQHPETKRLAQLWAGPDHVLVCADFYFWQLGSELQRTVQGLLQSILYQIFKACPELIQSACPSRWECDQLGLGEIDTWTEEELSEALKVIARQPCSTFVGQGLDRRQLPVKFMIFIDGLDEYEGNHRELLELVADLSRAQHVRLCVSSRPRNFASALDVDGKTFRLEDHTRGDIEKYVRGELDKAAKVQITRSGSRKRQRVDYSPIVNTIVERSNGVFLWVYLVVRSLGDGLHNGDSIAILQRRVEELPTELVGYFRLMLKRLDETYQKMTAQVLFIAGLPHRGFGALLTEVSFVDLWHLGQDPDYFVKQSFAVDSVVTDCATTELADMLLQMTVQVRAWCLDFLHIPDLSTLITRSRSGIEMIQNGKIQYLHRTVHEFLSRDDIRPILQQHVPEHFNDPDFSARLALARLKIVPRPGDGTKASGVRDHFLSKSVSLLMATCTSSDTNRRLSQELDKLGEHYIQLCGSSPIPYQITDTSDLVATPLPHVGIHRAIPMFLEHTLLATPNAYIAEILRQTVSTAEASKVTEVMFQVKINALTTTLRRGLRLDVEDSQWDYRKIDIDLVQNALVAGANPDAPHKVTPCASQNTIWQVYLERAIACGSAVQGSPTIPHVTELMLNHGADPDASPTNARNGTQRCRVERNRTLLEALLDHMTGAELYHLRSLASKCSGLSWRARVLAEREGPFESLSSP